ncbi:serine hydrolase domain-containing protein [Algoriphagus boritolerans]|uniref:serine hydrolase domain-containing protein n=1 Tax=Algoriphagus boritolerans TaxID=308111 RepID=UPI000A83722E
MIQKTLSTILFSLVLICSGLAQSSLSTDRLTRYDAYFQNEIDEGRLPGVVTLVYKNGEKVHESALGYNDFSAKTPASSDQIYYIQSMTKPIITAAFMMLYEEGHFFS